MQNSYTPPPFLLLTEIGMHIMPHAIVDTHNGALTKTAMVIYVVLITGVLYRHTKIFTFIVSTSGACTFFASQKDKKNIFMHNIQGWIQKKCIGRRQSCA